MVMSDLQISFFDCACALRAASISVTASAATAYTYVEQAGRALKHWITVTAKRFCRNTARVAREYVRRVFHHTGIAILRRSAVLRL